MAQNVDRMLGSIESLTVQLVRNEGDGDGGKVVMVGIVVAWLYIMLLS